MKTLLLGDIATVVSGGTPKRSEPEYFGGKVPWVKIGDMLQGTVLETDELITEAGLTGSSAKLLPAGTLLLSIFATIGRTAILGCDAATNQAIAGISIHDEDAVHKVYLRRFLEYSAESLANKGRGVAQANINLSILRSHKIPLPPIEEQRRIAAVLDAADDLRTKRRQALAKLDTLTQAIFIDMFGDPYDTSHPCQPLSDVTIRITYGFTSPMSHVESGVPIITAKNVRIGAIDYSTCRFAVQEEVDALTAKSKPMKGDLLLTKDGTIGRYAVFESDTPVCINQSVALVRPDPTVLGSQFLAGWAGSEPVQRRFDRMKKGNALAHLQISELAKMPIPTPSIEAQVMFEGRVRAVDAARRTARRSAEEIDTLFSSLQQRAFAGEL